MTTSTQTPLRTRSLRRRVTVTVLVFLAAMVLLLAITADRVLSARLEGQLEQRLTDRAQVADALDDQVDPQDLVDRLEGDGVSVRLTTAAGRTYVKGALSGQSVPQPSSGPGGPGPGPAPPAGPDTPVIRTGDLLTVSAPLSGGGRIDLIADATDVRRTLDQVRIALAVGGAIVLLLAALALTPVVRRVLRPLDTMTDTAADIAAGDRGRRLRPDRPETELGRTAAAFDAMLDAVEGAEASARAAEQRQRDFLSDAAHELRTPIAAVSAAAEQLVRGTPDRRAVEQLSVTVVREARRASRMVDDLLTTARLDQGLPLARRPIDLLACVAGAVRSVALGRGATGITLAGEPLTVSADPDRVAQVVANLLVNAVAAAGPDARIEVTVGEQEHGGFAVVTVTDDGPGVPPADVERVFDRLVRLDPSRSRTGTGGAGLGLTICRAIARAHGGDLVCRPAPPATGGCFELWLPPAADASA